MYKIVRLFEDNTLEHEKKVLAPYDEQLELVVRPSYTEEEVIENAKDADYILVGYEPITKKVLQALPNLKMVAFRSIGFNGIDLAYANEIGMPVTHISTYCIQEVADYVVGAILMHNRRLLAFNDSVKRDKKWVYDLYPDMRRLGSETVGFIGFGNITRLVSERLKPFGCRMLAYDPFVKPEVFAQFGVTQVDLADIFRQADYISSHLPLNEHTREMLNMSLFEQAEHKPVFINSSRGGVVNESDLVDALNKGYFSYAILDVLQEEYPDLATLPFMEMSNVVLTPHVAFYSQEAFLQSAEDSLMNIVYHMQGEYEKIDWVNREHLTLD